MARKLKGPTVEERLEGARMRARSDGFTDGQRYAEEQHKTVSERVKREALTSFLDTGKTCARAMAEIMMALGKAFPERF